MKPPIVQKNPPHSMYDDVIYRLPLTLLVKSIMQNHARVKHKVFQITLLLHYLKLGHLRPIQFQNYLQIHSFMGTGFYYNNHKLQLFVLPFECRYLKYTSGHDIWRKRNSSSFLGYQSCHRHGPSAEITMSLCHFCCYLKIFKDSHWWWWFQ